MTWLPQQALSWLDCKKVGGVFVFDQLRQLYLRPRWKRYLMIRRRAMRNHRSSMIRGQVGPVLVLTCRFFPLLYALRAETQRFCEKKWWQELIARCWLRAKVYEWRSRYAPALDQTRVCRAARSYLTGTLGFTGFIVGQKLWTFLTIRFHGREDHRQMYQSTVLVRSLRFWSALPQLCWSGWGSRHIIRYCLRLPWRVLSGQTVATALGLIAVAAAPCDATHIYNNIP